MITIILEATNINIIQTIFRLSICLNSFATNKQVGQMERARHSRLFAQRSPSTAHLPQIHCCRRQVKTNKPTNKTETALLAYRHLLYLLTTTTNTKDAHIRRKA